MSETGSQALCLLEVPTGLISQLAKDNAALNGAVSAGDGIADGLTAGQRLDLVTQGAQTILKLLALEVRAVACPHAPDVGGVGAEEIGDLTSSE